MSFNFHIGRSILLKHLFQFSENYLTVSRKSYAENEAARLEFLKEEKTDLN